MGEKLSVVDDNDEVVGAATKKNIIKKGQHYRCTHTFIFNKKDELLISKRPHNMKRFPDKWSASAGGKVDAGESYEESAKRELFEELGIKVKIEKVTEFVLMNSFDTKTKIFHQLFKGFCEGGFKPIEEEIEEIKWVTLEWLMKDMESNPGKYAEPFILAFNSFLKANKKL